MSGVQSFVKRIFRTNLEYAVNKKASDLLAFLFRKDLVLNLQSHISPL